MEFLRKIAYVCRMHYEKVILIIALVGLAVAVLILYGVSRSEADKLREYFTGVERKSGKPVPPVNLSRSQAAIQQAEKPPALNFSAPHNVFNAVKWQRKADATLIKIQTGKEVGPEAMVITEVTPLHFIVSLERVASAGGYYIGITQEAAERPAERRKTQHFATLNAPTRFFTLREIKGPPEDPTELVLELKDAGEKVTISKDKPYMRPEGFEADLKYTVDGKIFANQRVGHTLRFGGEEYKIVAINPTEVVMSANLNDKKYTVRRLVAR